MPTFSFLRDLSGLPEADLERIRTLVERVARDHDLEVFDVQLRRESVGWVLRVILDRRSPSDAGPLERGVPLEGGVSIDDCQRVSRELGALLDVDDPVDRHYTLEVSSPGLDRPLRGADDYRRFAGRLAKIVVREAIDGQKYFLGRLRELEADVLVIETDRGSRWRIPLANIARARLEVEF